MFQNLLFLIRITGDLSPERLTSLSSLCFPWRLRKASSALGPRLRADISLRARVRGRQTPGPHTHVKRLKLRSLLCC